MFNKHMDNIREQQLKQAQEHTMPSMVDMGKDLLKTAAATVRSAVAGEGISLTAEEAEKRLAVCQACEFYVDNTRCSKCGCYMATKTYLKAANCPVGKW
jgi:hypothetical protein